MSEITPTASEQPKPKDQSETGLAPSFRVEPSSSNMHATFDAEGNPSGGIIVNNQEKGTQRVAGDYAPKDEVIKLIENHEGLTGPEREAHLAAVMGKQATELVVTLIPNPNSKADAYKIEAIVGDERVGGGGKFRSKERHGKLSEGPYAQIPDLPGVEATSEIAPETTPIQHVMVNTEGSLLAPVSAQEAPSAPEHTAADKKPAHVPLMTLENAAKDFKEQSEKSKWRQLIQIGLTKAALVGIGISASFGGSGGEVAATAPVDNETSVTTVTEQPVDPFSPDQAERQEAAKEAAQEAADKAAEEAAQAAEAAQSYEFPFNWAADKYGEAEAMDKLHQLGAAAQEAGHTVTWTKGNNGEDIIWVDGRSDTAYVVDVLDT